MPKCKYCGEKLTRLDTDICPFCGSLKPLQGVENTTQDLTKVLDVVKTENIKYKPKRKSTYIALTGLLGTFGAGEFYIHNHVKGLISLGITVVTTGIAFLLSYFLMKEIPNNMWYVIIITASTFLFNFAIHLVRGLFKINQNDLETKEGELLK